MAMHKNRLLFAKEGRACYISHLDLMATFQRAFLRAGIEIWQTQGFNRHSYVSIALPLSVGYTSVCEILEFNLESDMPYDEVVCRMNQALPEGVRVLDCYEAEIPLKKITWLDWTVTLEYDNGVPQGVAEAFHDLLDREHYVIQKKSKKAKRGYTEVDIIPMVQTWSLEAEAGKVVLRAQLLAQNPGLNPSILLDTVTTAHTEIRPDFVRYHRNEVYGETGAVFR